MKQVIRYYKNNRATRIVRSTGPSGRQCNLGDDKQTKPTRKTRNGAAMLLVQCDETVATGRDPIFSPSQREALIERANGGSANLYRPNGSSSGRGRKPPDPLKRGKDEDEDAYIRRISIHLKLV